MVAMSRFRLHRTVAGMAVVLAVGAACLGWQGRRHAGERDRAAEIAATCGTLADFTEAWKSADRLVIFRRTGKTLLDSRDPELLKRLRACLVMVPPRAFGYCLCTSLDILIGYRGKRKLVEVTTHGNGRIRWTLYAKDGSARDEHPNVLLTLEGRNRFEALLEELYTDIPDEPGYPDDAEAEKRDRWLSKP